MCGATYPAFAGLAVQIFLLNNQVIGHCNTTKYKQAGANSINEQKVSKMNSGTLYLFLKNETIATPRAISNTNHTKELGCFFSKKDCPSLFKKIFASGSYLTGLFLTTIKGTRMNDNHISAEDKNGECSTFVAIKDKLKPVDIPNQKIRFQKLSLLIGCLKILYYFLLLLISYLKVKYHTYILPCLVRPCKLIRYFLAYFLITLGAQANFASDMPQLIHTVEKEHGIPSGLLAAIAEVESGLKPYAIGVSGKSIKASSTEEAKQIIKEYLAKGITNIDIGIMQINWRWHAKEFDQDLDNMLNPSQNIIYAAQLLKSLHEKHQSWQKAVRYHSAKGEYHRKYLKAVLVSWLRQN
ncbi:transglycosylase SLT domain-containing protein [Candidatus Rickettsia colombianensi]|uniref:transglycosylase SLT domain-containing protein n=1 Tax=Candidatus Rickettsia colombianensi TaxID=1090944 RepID=UPI001FEA1209|nr:transglycosylase SLT domain-containing protein [Candidatus Rickettsia colombianensi]